MYCIIPKNNAFSTNQSLIDLQNHIIYIKKKLLCTQEKNMSNKLTTIYIKKGANTPVKLGTKM